MSVVSKDPLPYNNSDGGKISVKSLLGIHLTRRDKKKGYRPAIPILTGLDLFGYFSNRVHEELKAYFT
jgi:hypothetical protein